MNPGGDHGLSRRAVLARSGALAFGAALGVALRNGPAPAATAVQLRNAATGLYLDGLGATGNGASVVQSNPNGSANQQWTIESDGSYVRIRNAGTGLYVDGAGATTNGAAAEQWSDTNSNNQQWTQVSDGGNVRFQNRATGLYLDGLGNTGSGSTVGQWSSSGSTNQQWALVSVSSGSGSPGYTFDTGSGLVFTIDPSNGNLTSLKHNGVELASGAAGQFESGWSSASVTATGFDGGDCVLYAANNSSIGVTQYYFARKGDNTIYLATHITEALNPGEARFIARVSDKILTNSPVAAKTAGATVDVEGTDVYGFSNGTTASKFYSSERFIVQQPFGASGNGHGVFIVGGTHEMSSGGPFFRDIEVNDTGSAVNITHYMYSGHAQTEPTLRLGLHGPYAMAVTSGAAPSASLSMDFLSGYIPGLLSVAQRGTVTGSASGSWGGQSATAALSGPNGEYWAPVSNGRFTIAKVRPGTYTATLYAGELAVGGTASVTVSAGQTASLSLSGNVPANGTIFQLGSWDGTPRGFLNADKIETMHPSDVRMANWNVGTVNVSAGAGAVPMAMFKTVNSPLNLEFSLGSVPANGVKLRIGITIGFAGGRPAVGIGGWSSPSSASPPSTDLNSRGITRGTWRGVNQTYTFSIPASALRAGTNTLAITVISGSSGTGYLSPAFAFDAIALDPA